MAYQNGKSYDGPRTYAAKPWNDIHKAIFRELLALPKMKGTKTETKLREWAKEKEPTNALKCFLLQTYAEWVHRPKKEVVIRPYDDNGNFGNKEQTNEKPAAGKQQPAAPEQPADDDGLFD
jgi:hypothetical protein